jgi:hypothetical protein
MCVRNVATVILLPDREWLMPLPGYVMLAMAMWLSRPDWLALTELERWPLLDSERWPLLDSERLLRASGMLFGSRLLYTSLELWTAASGVGLGGETLLLFSPIAVEGRL